MRAIPCAGECRDASSVNFGSELLMLHLSKRAGQPADPVPERTGSIRGLSLTGYHNLAYVDWGPRDANVPVICPRELRLLGLERVSADIRTGLYPRAGIPRGKSFARPETGAGFLASLADSGRQRPRYPASPAAKPRKVKDYSDGARKRSLRRTACRCNRSLQRIHRAVIDLYAVPG
jgi:hypothetical protein